MSQSWQFDLRTALSENLTNQVISMIVIWKRRCVCWGILHTFAYILFYISIHYLRTLYKLWNCPYFRNISSIYWVSPMKKKSLYKKKFGFKKLKEFQIFYHYRFNNRMVSIKNYIIITNKFRKKYSAIGKNWILKDGEEHFYIVSLNFNRNLWNFYILLSSINIGRKYWIRENFRHPVFDGFTCLEMSWTQFDHF